MNILKRAKSLTNYQINIFHTRPNYPKDVIFLRCFYGKTADREELIRIFWHAFETANPTYTIKKVEAQKIE